MDAFLNWFFAFMTTLLQGLWEGLYGIFLAFFQFFNFPVIIDQLERYKGDFNALGWILCILAFILAYSIPVAIILLIVLALRKYLRFRKTLVGNEDLLEEIADLHRDVVRLTAEKEKIMTMRFDPTGVTYEQLREMFENNVEERTRPTNGVLANPDEKPEEQQTAADPESKRFYRLSAVDEKYTYYVPPVYKNDMSLKELCDDIRNFACSRSKLYYEIKPSG